VSTVFFVLAGVFALGLAISLIAVLGAQRRRTREQALRVLDSAPQHLSNMGPIRQCLDPADLRYVLQKGGADLAGRLRHERRRVAYLYLDAIRRDFDQLLRIARVVALMSPEISGTDEMQRLRLTLLFRIRFQLVKAHFLVGAVAIPQLTALGEMVSSLAIQTEASIERLGERAALAAELALESDRS
jgi:hypothetical protein